MKKISVIIPLYNRQDYIGQCLNSVMGQTYQNLEILVIDDGSSDKGPEICREYAAAEERIRVLRQENSGVSAARNRGIQAAEGAYVFFLDSDDVIHPRLLEELLGQAEKNQAQLAFCAYYRCDSGRLERIGEAFSGEGKERRVSFLTADGRTSESWFHEKYTEILSGIGGKLILRETIGSLRFDRELTNGEDTFFLYQLIRKQVRSVYCPEEWYYYRTHSQSVTNSSGMAAGKRYFDSARRIRDGEYERGREAYALRWEILAADQIRRSYTAQKKRRSENSRQDCRRLRQIAAAERRHPMFRRICASDRVLFACCFACYPLYMVLDGIAQILAKRRN